MNNTKVSKGVLEGLENYLGHGAKTGGEAIMDALVKLCWGHEGQNLIR